MLFSSGKTFNSVLGKLFYSTLSGTQQKGIVVLLAAPSFVWSAAVSDLSCLSDSQQMERGGERETEGEREGERERQRESESE